MRTLFEIEQELELVREQLNRRVSALEQERAKLLEVRHD